MTARQSTLLEKKTDDGMQMQNFAHQPNEDRSRGQSLDLTGGYDAYKINDGRLAKSRSS